MQLERSFRKENWDDRGLVGGNDLCFRQLVGTDPFPLYNDVDCHHNLQFTLQVLVDDIGKLRQFNSLGAVTSSYPFPARVDRQSGASLDSTNLERSGPATTQL